jgi:hypothetical protein
MNRKRRYALYYAPEGEHKIQFTVRINTDRLRGPVVGVPGYRSRGLGSIPGASRFSEKYWNGVRSTSWVQLKSYLEKNSSDSGIEIREYGRRDTSRWPRGTLYPQKLVLTSPTNGGRFVGIVLSQTQTTEISLVKWR